MTNALTAADRIYRAATDSSLPTRSRISYGAILRQIIANVAADSFKGEAVVSSIEASYSIKLSDDDKRAIIFGINSIMALSDRVVSAVSSSRTVDMFYAIGQIAPSTAELMQAFYLCYANGFMTPTGFTQYALSSTSPEAAIVIECAVNGCRVVHNKIAEALSNATAKDTSSSNNTTGNTTGTTTDSNSSTGNTTDTSGSNNTSTDTSANTGSTTVNDGSANTGSAAGNDTKVSDPDNPFAKTGD